MFIHAIHVAIAGAVGTALRAVCTELAVRWFGTAFPWGTLFVNVAGSLAFGFIVGLARGRTWLTPALEAVLLTGLLGGFTTYSAFAFQSCELIREGRGMAAFLYISATNLLAVAAVVAGLSLGGGH